MGSVADFMLLLTEEPALGKGGIIEKRQPIYYSGVLAGAIGQAYFVHYREGAAFDWGAIVIALIVSLTTFAFVYERAGLNRAKMSFAKWCVAFQYGFFWPIVFGVIEKYLGA